MADVNNSAEMVYFTTTKSFSCNFLAVYNYCMMLIKKKLGSHYNMPDFQSTGVRFKSWLRYISSQLRSETLQNNTGIYTTNISPLYIKFTDHDNPPHNSCIWYSVTTKSWSICTDIAALGFWILIFWSNAVTFSTIRKS